tara:strand:+ start:1125 stop:1937 length:813 start_codon:yes stop_codon:yes gene_type:complete
MIFWIASYPKSGNTWLRLLIANYLWPNNSNPFESLKFIDAFPKKKFFQGLVDENTIKKDGFEIFKYFITAQDKINLNDEINILKTHNSAVSIQGHQFTNSQNSCGAVYIVRDPRSVAVSHAHHHKNDFQKSTSNMLNDRTVAFNDKLYMEARLSWKVNYISWKKTTMPKIIIKYEDLHKDTFSKFLEVLKFINQFKKIEVNEDKIKEVIIKCSFNKLSENEKKIGFNEKKGKENFFRKGSIDEWKTVLKEDLVKKIEQECAEEMKELKYI